MIHDSLMETVTDMADNMSDLSKDYYNLKSVVNDLTNKARVYAHILKVMKRRVYGDDARLIYSQFKNSIKFDSPPKEIIGVYDCISLEPIPYTYDNETMRVSVVNDNDAQILYLIE